MKNILNYFNFSKKKIYLGGMFLILSEILNLFLPIVLLTSLTSYKEISYPLLIILGIGYCISLGISAAGKVLIIINSQESLYSFRRTLWEHIISLPTTFFDSSKSGFLVSHFLNDSQLINDFYFASLPIALPSLLGFLVSLIIVFIIDFKLSLILLFSLTIVVLSLVPINYYNYQISNRLQLILAEISAKFADSIKFIKIIKTNSSEKSELHKGQESLIEYKSVSNKQVYITSLLEPLSSLVILLMVAFVGVYLTKRFENTTIAISDILVITIYLIHLFLSGTKLLSYWVNYSSIRGVSSTLKNIINLPTENLNILSNSNESLFVSKLTFENVCFTYENSIEKVLDMVSFSANKGDIILIIGEIGSGKTTIFYLISQLYNFYDGNIFINDKNIKDINLKNLRNAIGYVPQNPQLLDDTLENNIVYNYDSKNGNTEILDEIKTFGIYDFIEKLPKGYQTKVGEGNHQVSGGQQQLITIARTIFNPDKEIILLDEITSNLDPNKEEQVKELIKHNSENRITFFITHKLANIEIATKILFLENGKVSGFDTHDNLYKKSKKYRSYHELYIKK